MDKTVEKLTEIGTVRSGNGTISIVLYQRVTQEVRFTHAMNLAESELVRPHTVEPLDLKGIRQLRRLLGQAENKMRKLIEKMAREKKKQ